MNNSILHVYLQVNARPWLFRQQVTRLPVKTFQVPQCGPVRCCQGLDRTPPHFNTFVIKFHSQD